MSGKQYDYRSAGGTGISNGLHRREFLAGSVMAGAAWFGHGSAWAQTGPLHCVPPLSPTLSTPFAPSTGPVRLRKSVFDLDANEIARLKAAYAALRNVYRDDARSWYSQGLVHCWYCSGALDGLYGLEIHGGWWFLPWHRAYLYFHEQILGQLINDPSFTLPYWDWDTADRNRFPVDVYGTAADTGNPLSDPTRAISAADRIPDFLVGATVMQGILSAASFADFGGSSDFSLPVFADVGGDPQQAGAIEGAPHGGVHLWVTNPTNLVPPAVNMGSLGTAAFDPVFFAHHANIDRLWSVWAQTAPHANPDSSRWLNEQPFYFYDNLQNWTDIRIAQVIDHATSLRYEYQPPSAPTVGVAVAASATAPRLAQMAPLSAPLVELTPTDEVKTLTSEPTTVEIAPPPELGRAASALGATPGQGALVLRIDGVEIPADRAAVVKVFLNQPDANAATEASAPGFVGTIVVVPSTVPGEGHAHRTVSRNFGFALSEELAATLQGGDSISVTLVPATGDGRAPAEVNVTYRRVYIASR